MEVLAIGCMLACTTTMIGIWLSAAAQGDSITLTINEYGERTPELVMWAIVVPIISVGLHHWTQR